MVEAFVDAKMERSDISVTLYRVAADVGGPTLIKRIGERTRKAVEAALETAPDIESPPDKFAVEIMFQPWGARCVRCWSLGHPRRRSEKHESNSCCFASHTWPP